jgi:hypothetical protein
LRRHFTEARIGFDELHEPPRCRKGYRGSAITSDSNNPSPGLDHNTGDVRNFTKKRATLKNRPPRETERRIARKS